jgi:hypothetical protein
MYACYSLDTSGKVTDAWVIRETGDLVEDPAVLKRAGAWQWVGHAESKGTIVSRAELFNVGVIMALVPVFWLSYYWLPRPGRPADASRWWQRSRVLFGFAFVPSSGSCSCGTCRASAAGARSGPCGRLLPRGWSSASS